MTWSMNCFFVDSLRFLNWRNIFSQMLPPILLQRSPFSKNAFFRSHHSHSVLNFINLSGPCSTSNCRNLTVWLLFFFHTLLNQSRICHMMFLFVIPRTLHFISIILLYIPDHFFHLDKVIIIDQYDTDIILCSSKKSYSNLFGWLTLFFMVEQNESEKERRTRRRYRNFLYSSFFASKWLKK